MMLNKGQIYLASKSPRRAELLQQIGVSFEAVDVDVLEDRQVNESARDFVQRLATDKASAGWQASDKSCPVLGADTVVVLDDEILGKPASQADAENMLASLSGREHTVMTAIALVNAEQLLTRLNCSQVSFREITEIEIKNYVASGEPLDKAGAYAIQGQAAVFIEHLQGSYSGVMGLPLFETADLLRKFGIQVV